MTDDKTISLNHLRSQVEEAANNAAVTLCLPETTVGEFKWLEAIYNKLQKISNELANRGY